MRFAINECVAGECLLDGLPNAVHKGLSITAIIEHLKSRSFAVGMTRKVCIPGELVYSLEEHLGIQRQKDSRARPVRYEDHEIEEIPCQHFKIRTAINATGC